MSDVHPRACKELTKAAGCRYQQHQFPASHCALAILCRRYMLEQDLELHGAQSIQEGLNQCCIHSRSRQAHRVFERESVLAAGLDYGGGADAAA